MAFAVTGSEYSASLAQFNAALLEAKRAMAISHSDEAFASSETLSLEQSPYQPVQQKLETDWACLKERASRLDIAAGRVTFERQFHQLEEDFIATQGALQAKSVEWLAQQELSYGRAVINGLSGVLGRVFQMIGQGGAVHPWFLDCCVVSLQKLDTRISAVQQQAADFPGFERQAELDQLRSQITTALDSFSSHGLSVLVPARAMPYADTTFLLAQEACHREGAVRFLDRWRAIYRDFLADAEKDYTDEVLSRRILSRLYMEKIAGLPIDTLGPYLQKLAQSQEFSDPVARGDLLGYKHPAGVILAVGQLILNLEKM
jgi:hypothetical protein